MDRFWSAALAGGGPEKKTGLAHLRRNKNGDSWYLWFHGRCGVYGLELKGTPGVPGYDWVAAFTIKYYPSEGESSFNGLSALEKICRRSEVFQYSPDEAGIPFDRYRKMIPDDFFHAGELIIAFNDGDGSIFRIRSQTYWQVVMTRDFAPTDCRGNPLALVGKGEVDRNFPGLGICRFLFDSLSADWALFNGFSIQREMSWKAKGVRFLSDGQRTQAEQADDLLRIVAQREFLIRDGERPAPLFHEEISGMEPLEYPYDEGL